LLRPVKLIVPEAVEMGELGGDATEIVPHTS
jgi:hypothetical protein